MYAAKINLVSAMGRNDYERSQKLFWYLYKVKTEDCPKNKMKNGRPPDPERSALA
jgi:hypothetical protein